MFCCHISQSFLPERSDRGQLSTSSSRQLADEGPVPERRNNPIPGINVSYFRDNFIPGINSVPGRRNNAIKEINLG